MERRLTLIDVDENPFVVSLKDDRIQLCAVDSRPELEGSELRVFAAALFAAYAAPPLVGRLDAARAKICDVRDKLALAGAADELLAALDGSLCAIADARTGLTAGVPSAALTSQGPSRDLPGFAAGNLARKASGNVSGTASGDASRVSDAPAKRTRRVTSSSCRLP